MKFPTKYHAHPGVALANVAGEYLLVAAGDARGKLPYLKNINATGVWFWKKMANGTDLSQIISDAIKHYGITKEQAEAATESFFDSLRNEGYIIIDEF